MPQKSVSAVKTVPDGKATEGRKTGTLCLFLTRDDSNPGSQAGPPADLPVAGSMEGNPVARPVRPVPPYARFRFCRGFIDDLNRILPIRIRIRLEAEVFKGRTRGQVEGPALRFRWEFLEP